MVGAISYSAYRKTGLGDYVKNSVGLFDKNKQTKKNTRTMNNDEMKYKGSNKSVILGNLQFPLDKERTHLSQ